MLPLPELETAVHIQRTGYRLFRWLADAVDRGLIQTARPHSDAGPTETTHAWLVEHYALLPAELRPPPSLLEPFSNYFASYLTSSFDLADHPRQISTSRCGCYCPICVRMVNLSRVQPKKLTKQDKRFADDFRVRRVVTLAAEEGLSLDETRLRDLASAPEWRRRTAYSAYGQSLLERVRGDEGGPYCLALWREIAWSPEGPPIQGFELRAEDVAGAERELVAEMRRSSSR